MRIIPDVVFIGFLWRLPDWVVIVLLPVFSFARLYRFGPNLRDRRWQSSFPSAVVVVTLWVVSALVLRLYLTGAAISVGGEANSEMEKAATEAGHPDVRRHGARRKEWALPWRLKAALPPACLTSYYGRYWLIRMVHAPLAAGASARSRMRNSRSPQVPRRRASSRRISSTEGERARS